MTSYFYFSSDNIDLLVKIRHIDFALSQFVGPKMIQSFNKQICDYKYRNKNLDDAKPENTCLVKSCANKMSKGFLHLQ
jgi:hypothetical protein